jgi:hypothetical protein
MTVIELIAELGRLPPDVDVCVWDHDEDEYMPVVEALLEDGSTHVDLLVRPSGAVPAEMIDCPACRGYGHFSKHGKATVDKAGRKCLDCAGSGKLSQSDG